MQKHYQNFLNHHSKSKAILNQSPKLTAKKSSRNPDILVHSFDSKQLLPKPKTNRIQTPPHTPSQKSLKRSIQQEKTTTLKDDKQRQQKRLLGKSTVKLQINLFEGLNIQSSNDIPLLIATPNNPNKISCTSRKPLTPQTKIISFNLEQFSQNKLNNNLNPPPNINPIANPAILSHIPSNSNLMNPSSNIIKLSANSNIPSSTLNLSATPNPNLISDITLNILPTTTYPPSLQQYTPSEIATDRKNLINEIIKAFSLKMRPPQSKPSFYRTRHPLGKGSFGKVLLCTQLLTDKHVAIKLIEKAHLKNSLAEKRVLQEIQLLRKLDHRNVVKLLEVFETDTTIYLVMEYMDKGDLYTLLKTQKKGRLTEIQVKPLFLQILRGLEYIHSQGILHRDIKLDNILLDQTFNLKICDFGISRTLIPAHKMTEQSGTPAFMAPEIISGGGYEGFGSDIWSLGIVLYCLLTGTLPFRGNSASELNNNIMKGTFNKEIKVSDEAKDLLDRLLNIKPEKRITMKEIWGHPWVSGEVYQEETINLMPNKSLNEEIMKKIEGFGFSKEFINRNIDYKSLGHVNVCYFTLLH